MLSQKLQNSITLLLILNHFTYNAQRIQYTNLSLAYKSLQYNKPSSISDLLTIRPTRSTRPGLCSCHSSTPFQSIKAQSFLQFFLLSSSCSLECSTTPSSVSFSYFSSPFSALTILFRGIQRRVSWSGRTGSGWVEPGRTEPCRAGSGWVGPGRPDRAGPGRVGSGRVGSGRVGSGRAGLDRVEPGWVGPGRVGPSQAGRAGSGRAGSGRVESGRVVLQYRL